MKSRLLFLLKLTAFWLFYFLFNRLLFLLYHFNKSKELPFTEWFGAFASGVRMDLSMVGYVILFVSVMLAVLLPFSEKINRVSLGIFNFLLIVAFSVISVADLELYSHWGFRIDATPLFYLQNPAEAAASLPIWFQLLLVVLIAIISSAFIKLYRFFPNQQVLNFPNGRWWNAPILLLIAGSSIIPIRGGFDKATMNAGTVYFSSNMFSNHAALNVVWNFMYGVVNKGKLVRVYPQYMPAAEANGITNYLLQQTGNTAEVLNTARPNVVIILLESFSSKMVGSLGGPKGVVPNFDSLATQGLLFSNFYSASDRSDKGFVAILAGFPAQSTQSVIKYPIKTAKLPSISQVFDSLGYSTAFYYGGNADFTNMRSFLYAAKMQRIVSQDNFPQGIKRSAWGVHDEHLYQRLLVEMDTAKGPFFKLLFTLSGHEPFEVPMEPKFTGNGTESKFLSAAHYADLWLGWFMREVAKREYYRNTLFILLGDHGHTWPGKSELYEPARFVTPMLWLGGALKQNGLIETVGSQTDLAKTLLTQMNVNSGRFTFSRDLLSSSAKSFAYYVFNDGFGFVEPNGLFIWDHVGAKPIVLSSSDTTATRGFAFFTFSHRIFTEL